MKKFNEWANNFNEEISIAGSTNKSQVKGFEDFIGKIDSEHSKEIAIDKSHEFNLDRRSKLIRAIDLLHYENLEQFLKDWNFIKMHTKDENPKEYDNLNVIRNV
jgi:hypothetical protein